MAKTRQLSFAAFGPAPIEDDRLKARRDMSEKAFLCAIKRYGFAPVRAGTDFRSEDTIVNGSFRQNPLRLDRRRTLARIAQLAK